MEMYQNSKQHTVISAARNMIHDACIQNWDYANKIAAALIFNHI